MKALAGILWRVVVLQFYKLNAGFFLILFILLFATMQPPELLVSYPILSMIAASPAMLAVVFIVFILYFIKCLAFALKMVSEPSNEFLFYSALLEKKPLNQALVVVFIGIFFPALLYNLLIVIVAILTAHWLTVGYVILYNVALSVLFVNRFRKKISNYKKVSRARFDFFRQRPSRLYYGFYINFLTSERKVMLTLTKTISCLLLVGILNLFLADEYNLNFIYIGYSISLVLHALIIFEIRNFEDRYLAVLLNLPLRNWTYVVRIIAFMLILLPEMVVFAFYSSQIFTIPDLLILLLMGIAVLSAFHAVTYLTSVNMRNYLKGVFIIFLVLIFSFLFRVPATVMFLICVGFSYFITQRYHFQYESLLTDEPGV